MAEINSKDPFGINPLGNRRRWHVSDDPGYEGADNEEDKTMIVQQSQCYR